MAVPRALARPLAVLLAAIGCGGGAPIGQRAPAEQARGPAAGSPRAGDLAGEPLDEAEARRLLAARFRAAGLRVVEDVPLEVDGAALVVDGFDPARRIGYEYLAADELGLELGPAEREALAASRAVRLLVHEPAAAGALERAAEAFLAELPPP